MSKQIVISLIISVVLAQFAESKPAFQFLEPRSGYVPVFIRYGDTPLEDINPLLAEAFRAHEINARNIKNEIESSPDSNESSLNLSSLIPSLEKAEELSKNLPISRPAKFEKSMNSEKQSKDSDSSSKE